MKGLFIPDITAEMFRNGCLESIEVLMAEGEIYDIDYSPQPKYETVTEFADRCRECEREKVLDKLRAEIEALNPVDYAPMSSYEGHRGASDMKDDVLHIIDKYRTESEVDE